MHFGNNPELLRGLHNGPLKVALCLNANDHLGDIERMKYYEKAAIIFRDLGFDIHEIDLRNYFNKPDKLAKDLGGVGIFWAAGGNTFNLRRAFKMSSMDVLLPELLKNEEFVYGGFSAGSCVITPLLNGLDLVDNPKEVPCGYNEEIFFDGLNLVDFQIVPHFMANDKFLAEIMQKIIAFYQDLGVNYIALTDEQVIIIDTFNESSQSIINIVGDASERLK